LYFVFAHIIYGRIIIIVSIQVEELEEFVTPKVVPLTIPKIRVGAEVTLINIITHAFEVFRTPNIVLKDTPIDETLKFEPILLVELVNIIGELVDNLATRVEHVVQSDKFRK
jgi:hypothetical protein